MRTCYCRKCGTANQIDENEEKYFCGECGLENTVPQKRTEEKVKMVEETVPTYKSPFVPEEQPVSYTPSYIMPEADFSATVEEPVKEKKKKTGLIVTLSVILVVLIASATLLLAPIKSFLPIRFNCDECKKVKYSQKYEVTFEDNSVKQMYICDDCFSNNGFEELDD